MCISTKIKIINIKNDYFLYEKSIRKLTNFIRNRQKIAICTRNEEMIKILN